MSQSVETSTADIQEFQRVCIEAAHAGGKAIQSWIGRFEARKKGPADFVTQADLASQEAVRQVIAAAFPDHDMIGEEDDPRAPRKSSSPFRWIADPLDGTTNFVHGIPHYASSVALVHDDEVLVGAVFNPCMDEIYAAGKALGATLNGNLIRTSGAVELKDSVGAFGLPPSVSPDAPDYRVFLDATFLCQGLRRTGSAALNLCYLAAGRFDLFWSYSTKIWDVAAGALFVREAGGVVLTPQGDPWTPDRGDLLAAATPELGDKLLRMTETALAKPFSK